MDMVPSPHTNVTLSVLMFPSRQAARAVHMTKFDVTGLAVSLETTLISLYNTSKTGAHPEHHFGATLARVPSVVYRVTWRL